jgi:hypothetical protein
MSVTIEHNAKTLKVSICKWGLRVITEKVHNGFVEILSTFHINEMTGIGKRLLHGIWNMVGQ